MILNLYALKNRLSGIFERPFAEIYDEKEYPELLAQSLALANPVELNRHKEFDLYKVGVIDSKSGEITDAHVEFVCSLEQMCLTYLANKEGNDNVRKEA